MNASIKILIVDDHAVLRQGLKHILAEEWPHAVFGEAGSVPELMQLLRKDSWDVLLLDINLPGRNGLEALKEIANDKAHLPVLVLSGHPEDQYAIRVLKAGAAGYMTKETAPDELIQAVRKVLAGGRYVSAALAEKLAFGLSDNSDKLPHEHLSDREYQVLCLVASGKTPTEIAEELTLSVKTISTFRTRILSKMDMKTKGANGFNTKC